MSRDETQTAGCSSLSECITHLRVKSRLTGQPLVAAEVVSRFAFSRELLRLEGGFLW